MLDSFHKYPLFPDLLENQRRSIKFFWEKGILDELELFSTIIGYKKEKTGTRTLAEQKNLKKKQPEWGNVDKAFGSVDGGDLSAPLPFSTPGIKGLNQKTQNFKVLSSGNGKKVSGTKMFVSPKTFKKVFQEFGNPKEHFVNRTNLPSRLQWTVGRSFSELRSPEQLENRTFKKASSLSFVVKQKMNQFFDFKKSNHVIFRDSKLKKDILQLAGNKVFLPKNEISRPFGLSQVKKKGTDGKTETHSFAPLKQKPSFPVLPSSQRHQTAVVHEQNFVSKQNDSEYLVLHGSNFLVKAPYYSQSEAIKYQKTYSVGLFLPVSRKNILQETIPTETKFTSERDSLDVGCSTLETPKNEKRFWFYFGDIPLMTDRGSFIINGAPRVLVNQIIRCPSVYFKVKLDHKNRRTYIASFLSEYGSWLRLETDRLSNRLWARIDKSPRFPADLLLIGLGYNQNNLKKKFTHILDYKENRDCTNESNRMNSQKRQSNFQNELQKRFDTTKNFHFFGNKTKNLSGFPLPKSFKSKRTSMSVDKLGLENKMEHELSKSPSFMGDQRLKKSDVNIVKLEKGEETDQNAGLALQTIWKKCNPGRWTSSLGCYSFFYNKFLNPKRYSIGRVGRLRLNKRLLRNPECSVPTLTPEDILLAFNYLRQLRSADSVGNTKSTLELDDIDHLKNRRVRLPGEILQNQFRLALSRITYSALRFQSENTLSESKNIPKASLLLQSALQKQKSTRQEFLKKELQTSKLNSGKSGKKEQKHKPQILSEDSTKLRSFMWRSPPPPIPAFQNTLRELFNTGQLSQYMDQTNPLAEITHKRRLSSLGPGGVGRDQAGFAVREIHPSHFGRICPIETPEGQNAGLVGSLASYARINTDGFLQSPGVPIEQNAQVSSFSTQTSSPQAWEGTGKPQGRHKISLFSSELEDEIYVCTADTLNPIFSQKTEWQHSKLLDAETESIKTNNLALNRNPGNHSMAFPKFFPVRYKQEFLNIKGTDAIELTYGPTKLFTGICPIQLISLATSLIPFLEHDDANRALMGSNMQRQAVPFMITEKPFVGTGLELQAARDSSTILLAKESGQVVFVDANLIQIESVGGNPPHLVQKQTPDSWSNRFVSTTRRNPFTRSLDEKEVYSYQLTNFVPSNQSTSLKQRPAVSVGDWVEKGFLLADGSATKDGEVTLGKNVLLAYMPWEGYNFEDAIVINERLVFEDIYTSIHVERFEVDVKNTKILSLRTPEEEVDDQQNSPLLNQSTLVSRLTPGDYLTSDLDILMLRFDGQQFTKNRSGNTKMAEGIRSTFTGEHPESENSDSFRRPESLSHLDERGIVKPGAWVQEGDILVGKVQIGQKEVGNTGGVSPSRQELPHDINQYVVGSSDKTGNLQPPVRNLPFPEYRLLLAIFDLQNNRNNSSGELPNRLDRKDYLLSAEKKLLENEMGLSSGGLPAKAEKGGNISDPTSVISANADLGIRNETGKIENTLFGTGSLGSLPMSHPIKNTSVKVGIGVKGRVLECILDGELIKYGKLQERIRETSTKEGGPLQNTRLNMGSNPDKESLKESCSSVSIFLAHKKRIQLGDKMSGRHGNKGIVSLILPPQDMPYLQDGKAVDVVLNPLGVPSRMNVGQVLETLFGLSAFYYKKVYRIMPFDERINPVKTKDTELNTQSSSGMKPSETLSGQKIETSRSLVYGHLKKLRTQIQTGVSIQAGTKSNSSKLNSVKGNQLNWLFDPNNPGKTQIFDGRTGDIFYQPVLVGYSYMFKLIHLVDDKIHARSTGPYSLVTQQPLGGRSKKGGQRLGEMEVWALQGFGTASILQEFLTVKSDEIYSRNHFLFHLMRRNWDSLDKIPPLKRFDRESPFSRDANLPLVGEQNSALGTGNWNIASADSAKQSGMSDPTASVHSKLPESFRVLINELHALCLSVYSNLPN